MLDTTTVEFRCELPKHLADALNRESGRIYSMVLTEHYRIYRKKGIWLQSGTAEKLNDVYNGGSFLQAHSVDAAQQAFYHAAKIARTLRERGHQKARYPYKRKRYRTTVWKVSGIKVIGENRDQLRLSLARGYDNIVIQLSQHIVAWKLPDVAFREMRLVYNKQHRLYMWHLVIQAEFDDPEPPGNKIAAIDMGEIHPVAITNGDEAAIVSCRRLRAQRQHTHHILAAISKQQARCKKFSRRWWRLQRRKQTFLDKQKRRVRDLNHKISHETVAWCVENEVGELAIGDVRNIADGKRLNKKSQQKVSSWSHGQVRKYIEYKAKRLGIRVNSKINERHTSQHCPSCGKRHKPQGRVYTCPKCDAAFHRDIVGASNILSRHTTGELGNVVPVKPKYRYPIPYERRWGKRSSSGHEGNS
jgi:putative transposase